MRGRKKVKFIGLVFLIVILVNVKSIFKIFYPIKYESQIVEYSQKYNINPCLVAAVIKTESNFNDTAVSSKGAYGLMQIMPDTAVWIAENMGLKDFTIETLDDTEINISMGCWYINNLNSEFNGNIDLVLAAYNGGRGNVQKWLNNKEYSTNGEELDIIPFAETDKYVKKVRTNYNIYSKLYADKLGVSR